MNRTLVFALAQVCRKDPDLSNWLNFLVFLGNSIIQLVVVLDVLRAPTRLGVDTRREAIAAENDVTGVALPASSRSQPADVARAAGARVVVRAAGPGLLVIGEGYDPGWTARVDGVEARVLRWHSAYAKKGQA